MDKSIHQDGEMHRPGSDDCVTESLNEHLPHMAQVNGLSMWFDEKAVVTQEQLTAVHTLLESRKSTRSIIRGLITTESNTT